MSSLFMIVENVTHDATNLFVAAIHGNEEAIAFWVNGSWRVKSARILVGKHVVVLAAMAGFRYRFHTRMPEPSYVAEKLKDNRPRALQTREHRYGEELFVATCLSQSFPSRVATEQLLPMDGSSYIRGIFQRYSDFCAQNATPRSIEALKGPAADAQRATLDSVKRKLKPYAYSDVFERYSHLCARNVIPRYSPNLPQVALATNMSKMDKTMPKKTKPKYEIGRVQEIEAEGIFIFKWANPYLFNGFKAEDAPEALDTSSSGYK
ncbi:hypothetical protein Tco_0530281 [Tanacetum coccineum]